MAAADCSHCMQLTATALLGTRYTTLLSTLTSKQPDSMLATMFRPLQVTAAIL